MNLGGASIWTVDLDDFRGICGDPWPLLNTVKRHLGGSNYVPYNIQLITFFDRKCSHWFRKKSR